MRYFRRDKSIETFPALFHIKQKKAVVGIVFGYMNSSEKEVFKFWYNSKKTLRKESVFGVTAAQKYKFDKNGRITKRTETMTFANGEKSKTVYTYKYQKMKAPKSCTALIREQQSGFLGTGWSFFY